MEYCGIIATADWGDVPTWVGVLGGILAFCWGLKQYVDAQRWKRAEFIAAEMRMFFDDLEVRSALFLLDYSKIRLTPDGRRPRGGEESSAYTDGIVVSALRVHDAFEDETERFSCEEMFARTAFDALFTGLERFEHFIQAELVTTDDLRPYLGYWMSVIGDPEKRWKDPPFYAAVETFLKRYGYEGVEHLLARFGYRLGTEGKGGIANSRTPLAG